MLAWVSILTQLYMKNAYQLLTCIWNIWLLERGSCLPVQPPPQLLFLLLLDCAPPILTVTHLHECHHLENKK